jgi:archaellum component FlaC
MNIYFLQISTTASKSISMADIITWVSFATGILSIIFGIFAIFQSYHYNRVSSKTNESTNLLLLKLNDIVARLETVNGLMHDKFLAIFGKTMEQVTKGALQGGTTNDNLKKDLAKSIADGSEKIEGQIKSLTDTVDKSHLTIAEIKSSLTIVANAVQDVFNNVLNNIDDYDECSDEYEYLKLKILERCNTDVKVTVKDIFNNTSTKISIEKKIEAIKKMKEDALVNYQGDTLFDYTIVFLVRDLS